MESPRPKIEKEIYQGVNKICYTNVNGLMSTKLELEELLVRVKPDILVLCETKWKDEWGLPDIGDGIYDIWLKNRSGKGGGGVDDSNEEGNNSGNTI